MDSLRWPFLLYPLWATAVVAAIGRFLYQYPWGMKAERKRAIGRVQRKRTEAFEATAARVERQSEREDILGLSLDDLREALQRDKWTATQVLYAYMGKALEVHDRLNCITEPIEEAFEWAAEADEKWHKRSEKPPLYGVPFSVKANFHMRGRDCNLGLGKYSETPMEDECTFVTHLRSLGAIPFVITTVPQGLISFACSSSVYGTTGNPHDPSRSPGGSSGGECALLAGGGSPFGVGSDILGSLRIPAAFSGVVALKPTQARFVVNNSHGGITGRTRLGLGFGFFTRSVEEQIQLLKEIVGTPLYTQLVPDSSRQPIDEAKVEAKGKLRIGYFVDDGFLHPVPSVARAIEEVAEKLRGEGHEMVPFHVPEAEKAMSLMLKNAMPDGGTAMRSVYAHDDVDQYMEQFVFLLQVPNWLRGLGAPFIRLFSPQFSVMSSSYISSLDDLRQSNEDTDEYRLQFIQYWKSLGLDSLVCPAFPVTAVPHTLPSQLGACGFSTGLFNLIDFPAGVVPVSRVTKKDDDRLMDEGSFPTGRNIVLKKMREGCAESEGMPVGVQVVALPLEEEMCLRVMKAIEHLLPYDRTLRGKR